MELWVWAALAGVGAISGLISKLIFARRSPFGIIGNMIFGIVGGLLAGCYMAGTLDSSLNSLIKTGVAASLGALLLVFILKFIAHPKAK